MQIIQFEENQKEIWNKFIAENNSESFLQSWEWGEFQSKIGRKVWRIGIVNNDFDNNPHPRPLLEGEGINSKFKIQNSKFYLMALIVKYDLPFGRSYLYCPRGPVVNESKVHKVTKLKVLELLVSEIKKIAKEEKSLFLKIDPPIDWNIEYRIWNMEYSGFEKTSSEIQPRNTLILDITKLEEELLKDMKQKTRYNIRLAGKKELRIKSYELRMDNKNIFKEKFEEFWKLVEETSARDKFKSHDKNYYWEMLESLSEMQKASQSYGIMKPANSCGCSPKLQAKLYLAEYKNKIIVANIVLFFGDMAVYLHGASSNKYRNVMAPYLLQWQQILDAKKKGCKKYDFWGIEKSQESVKSKVCKVYKVKSDWGGITRFKKGFGGCEKNYIGAYELVFDNIGCTMFKFIRLIKSKVS